MDGNVGKLIKVVIIGAGASGLACAARLSYLLHSCSDESTIAFEDCGQPKSPYVQIEVLEQGKKVGSSILRTGNGRCNISNSHIDESLYNNPEFVQEVFRAAEETAADERVLSGGMSAGGPADDDAHEDIDIVFFRNRGLLLREETEGRLYPYPNKASAVLDVLMSSISQGIGCSPQCEILISAESAVCRICAKGEKHPFAVFLEDGSRKDADYVVIASGGKTSSGMFASIPMLEDAFRCTEPVLCPLALDSGPFRRLDNIRVRCSVALYRNGRMISAERGEVLFRKYGVSGIAVFNLSRHSLEGDRLSMDLMPEISRSRLSDMLRERARTIAATSECLRKARSQGALHAADDAPAPTAEVGISNMRVLEGMLLPEVAEAVLIRSAIDPDAAFADAAALAGALKDFSFVVAGKADTDHAQVRRGGIRTDAVDPSTLRVLGAPGLLATGEALDVDGPCGGYNLHFAWTSGLLAAGSIAESIMSGGVGTKSSGRRDVPSARSDGNADFPGLSEPLEDGLPS